MKRSPAVTQERERGNAIGAVIVIWAVVALVLLITLVAPMHPK